MKNKITQNEQKTIQNIANDLKKTKGVIAVLLFGSYSRGDQKPLSDIDLCVITKKNMPEKTKHAISGHGSRKVQISFFWDMPPSVRYAAIKEGKIIFSNDEVFLRVTTVETMSEYLDFRHIVDRNISRVFENE